MVSPPPLNDLKLHYQRIKDEVDAAIAEAMAGGWYILGERVQHFEEEFARYVGASYGIGVASGTEALRVALLALGTTPGDEVITVANAGVPPVAAIDAAGAHPVFVDVDPATCNMDPALLERAITPRSRAVLVVHLYGHPADMGAILAIARRHGLKVLEDCAQAHGAMYRGQRVGSLGDAAAFSFYPTKNLGAFGDAGMVTTSDSAVADRARLLRNYGWRRQYYSEVRGSNSRLDEVQAAVLLAKLPHLEEWNERRRRLAALYTSLLDGLVETPVEQPWARAVYHLYVVRTKERDALQAHLRARGIGTGIHYPLPVHLQPAYRHLGVPRGALPVTESMALEALSLPMYPELEEEQVEMVAAAIREFFREAPWTVTSTRSCSAGRKDTGGTGDSGP